jgi:CheY-like chemotaxis protein
LINGSGQLLAGSTQPETTITSPLRKKVRRETGNAMSRRLVLYINADPETRILVTRLSKRWHQVELVMADSAQSGIRSAMARRPDLVMIDVELPDMGGDALMMQLRILPVTALTPIVALSTDGTPEHRRSLLEAGASACLTRPVNIAEVQRSVGTLLGVGSLPLV